MKNRFQTAAALLLSAVLLLCTSCASSPQTQDIIASASAVYINDNAVDTVEARLGAFSGKSGDYIEFRFDEPKKLNTVFITEKTAAVTQFNIYATVDGEFKMLYAGTNILSNDIGIEECSVTTLRIEVAKTQSDSDEFIIQGVSAYFIETASEG